ncbi:MAG: GrpB family protein [Acidobacteria bacterium]|nr:GrpB family protein [Acidobacteriota bacterium]
MKVLLDGHLGDALRSLLAPHEVVTVSHMGWADLKNGELLNAAETGGMDVLLTGDRTHEQNLHGRRLAIVALSAVQLPILRLRIPAIIAAIGRASPGSFEAVDCGSFSGERSARVIGLERGIVEVVEHDPRWFILAAEACQAVRSACGELLVDVQHVGSTSVPELPSKPVLDIAAGMVSSAVVAELIPRLSLPGYIYRGDYGDSGGHLFVAESSPNVRTVHLHVVEHSSRQWREYLLFRDVLRRRAAIRRRYSQLKQGLASAYQEDRDAYTAGKAEFIRQVLDGRWDDGQEAADDGKAGRPRN